MTRFLHTADNHNLICGGSQSGYNMDNEAAGPENPASSGLMSAGTIIQGSYVYHYSRTTPVDGDHAVRYCFRVPVASWPPSNSDDWEIVQKDVLPRSVLDSDPDYADWIDDVVAAWIAEDPTERANYEFDRWIPHGGCPYEMDGGGIKFCCRQEITVADPADPDGTRRSLGRKGYVFDVAADMVTFSNPRAVIDEDGNWSSDTRSVFEVSGQAYFFRTKVVYSGTSPHGYLRKYAKLGIQPFEMEATTTASQGAALPGAPGAGFPVTRWDDADWSEIYDCADGGVGEPILLQWGRPVIDGGYVYAFQICNLNEIVQAKNYDPEEHTDPTIDYAVDEGVDFYDNPELMLVWRAALADVADGSLWTQAPSPAAMQQGRLKCMWSPNIIKINDIWWCCNETNLLNGERGSVNFCIAMHRHYGLWSAQAEGAHPGQEIQRLHGDLDDLFTDYGMANKRVVLRPFAANGVVQQTYGIGFHKSEFTIRELNGFWRFEGTRGWLECEHAPDQKSFRIGAGVTTAPKRFHFGGNGEADWPGPYDTVQEDPSYCGPGAPKANEHGYPPGARPQQWWPVLVDGFFYLQNRWNGLWLTSDGRAVYTDAWTGGPRQKWRVEVVE